MPVEFCSVIPTFRIYSQDRGMTEVTVVDPFNNRIAFGEPAEKPSA